MQVCVLFFFNRTLSKKKKKGKKNDAVNGKRE